MRVPHIGLGLGGGRDWMSNRLTQAFSKWTQLLQGLDGDNGHLVQNFSSFTQTLNGGVSVNAVLSQNFSSFTQSVTGGETAGPLSISGSELVLIGDLGITSSGGLITQWNDQSSSANNATASGSLRPSTSTLGGQPAVSFNGSTAMILGGTIPDNAKSIFAVYKLTSTPGASSGYTFAVLKSATPAFAFHSFRNVGGYQNIDWTDNNTTPVAGVGFSPTLDTSIHSLVQIYNGGGNTATNSYSAYLDGTSQTMVASGVQGLPSTDQGSIGSIVTNTNALVNPCNITLACLCVYSRALSSTEAATLHTWAQGKYGAP